MNDVVKRLGQARIETICSSCDLQKEDIAIVIEILDAWENLLGQNTQKALVAIEKTGNNPRRTEILRAMLDINVEYATRIPS